MNKSREVQQDIWIMDDWVVKSGREIIESDVIERVEMVSF